MPWILSLLLFASLTFMVPAHCPAREVTFDLDELEKKPYHLGGYGEVNPILFKLDKDAAFYKLRFYDRDEGSTLERYDMTLQVDGTYEKGIVRAFARLNNHLNHTYEGWSGKTTL